MLKRKAGKRGVGGVGVGSPNPLGEETSPLRLGLFFAPEERYVYRRAICPKPCAPEEHHVLKRKVGKRGGERTGKRDNGKVNP